MDNFNPGYYTCDNSFIDHYQALVGLAAAAVYQTLCRHCDRAGRCWPGMERLCARTGLRPRAVQLAVRTLVRYALIRVHPRSRESDRRGAVYEVLTPPTALDPLESGTMKKAHASAPEKGARENQVGASGCAGKAHGAPNLGACTCARSIDRSSAREGSALSRGGQGAKEGPPDASGAIVAHRLAIRWAELQTVRRGQLPADPADLVEPDLVELLRRGLPLAWLEREIEREDRDRGEYWSAFGKRARRSLAAYLANQTRRENKAPPAAPEKPPMTKEEWQVLRVNLCEIGLLPSLNSAANEVQ
jgi:Helix-turn-helix domain